MGKRSAAGKKRKGGHIQRKAGQRPKKTQPFVENRGILRIKNEIRLFYPHHTGRKQLRTGHEEKRGDPKRKGKFRRGREKM